MRRFITAVRSDRERDINDRGAILVFTAIFIVVLTMFAAVAVDLSGLFVTRRHAQTAADIGALAGAQSAGVSSDPAVAKQAVIDEIKAITAVNLDFADWDNCIDQDMPPEFSPLAGETPCISFTAGLKKIRVRVPDQTFDTIFAGVMGVATLKTSAVAVVEAWDLKNGDILPFGIPTGDAASTLGCPSDHPNGLFPCDGPDSGNFNRLEILQLGVDPPPNKDCTHSNGMFSDNIADGVDHPLGTYPDSLDIETKQACEDGDFNDSDPWATISSQPGIAASTLAPGLITGSLQFDGRLTEIAPSSTGVTTVFSESVDNTPLWSFIDNFPIGNNIGGVPASCQGPSFNAGPERDWDEDLWVTLSLDLGEDPDPILDDPDYDATDPTSHLESRDSFEHMARCLREYRFGTWSSGSGDPDYTGAGYDGIVGTGILFSTATAPPRTDPSVGVYDLQLSPRWGWAPVGDFSNGSKSFQITSFVPIYVNTLVSNCTGNECKWVWHAGQATPPGSPKTPQIASMISFQLPEESLPQAVFDFGPDSDFETPYTLIE